MKVMTSVLMVLLAAVSCIHDDPQQEFELKPGDRIPEFTVQMCDGTTVTSAELGHGPAVIMFFHTGCPDCQNTLPSVQRVYDDYKDEIKFILISREQPDEEILPYWKEKGYTMPYSPQKDRKIYNMFATSRVPRVYICSKGEIVNLYTDDPIPDYEDLLNDIQQIL